MSAAVAAQPASGYVARPGEESSIWQRLPPVIYVERRVLSDRCGLSPSARLVAFAIAGRMATDTDRKEKCFCSLRDIAARTGLTTRTVGERLRELRNLPAPFFLMRLGGVTRGRPHRCYSFELIRNPFAFAECRRAGKERERARRAKAKADALVRAGEELRRKEVARRRFEHDRKQALAQLVYDARLMVEGALGAAGLECSEHASIVLGAVEQLFDAATPRDISDYPETAPYTEDLVRVFRKRGEPVTEFGRHLQALNDGVQRRRAARIDSI